MAPFPLRDAGGSAFAQPFLGGFEAPRPQLADLDGDGDLDLAVQQRTGRVAFFENTGTPAAPAFTWRTDRYEGLDVGEWVRFADVDADGDLDALAETPLSRVRLYRNDGTPAAPAFTLAEDTLRTADGTPLFADRQNIPAVVALDCAGPPDLVLGLLNGRLAFYERTGTQPGGLPEWTFVSGSYQDVCLGPPSVCGTAPPKSTPKPASNATSNAGPGATGPGATGTGAKHGANALAPGDLDGDGDPDFLWGDFFSQSFYRIENTGGCPDARLARAADVFPTADPVATSGFNVPTLGDLTGDGRADLVFGILGGTAAVGRPGIDNLALRVQNAAGGFDRVTDRLVRTFDAGTAAAPALADFDGDGDADLVVGTEENPVVAESSTGGTLRFVENTGTPDAPAFDDRGTLDVAGLGGPGGDVRFNFAPAAADLDGDGDADLALGTFGGDVLFVRNDGADAGAPAFVLDAGAPPLATLPRGNFAAPALADLDGDGDADLVVGQAAGDGALVFFRNTGTPAAPQFMLESEMFGGLALGEGRTQPAFFDADADGDLDLFVGTDDGGVVFVRNTGTPTAPRFRPEPSVLAGLAAPRLAAPAVADLDADGDGDLLVGTRAGGLLFFDGTGAAPPAPPAARPVTAFPNPFTTRVTLAFTLAAPAAARLDVFDVLGRRVAVVLDRRLDAGAQTPTLDAAGLPSGVYVYRLTLDGRVADRGKLVRIR